MRRKNHFGKMDSPFRQDCCRKIDIFKFKVLKRCLCNDAGKVEQDIINYYRKLGQCKLNKQSPKCANTTFCNHPRREVDLSDVDCEEIPDVQLSFF